MTRPIKFRAWDKIRKCFAKQILDFRFKKNEINTIVYTHESKNTLEKYDNMNLCLPFDFEIMQYTGLTDKNGVEIFEGDIVKCQQGCPHQVVWDLEIGGTCGGGMPGWYLKGLRKNSGAGYAWTGEEEIIGNIYQTPELINKQN